MTCPQALVDGTPKEYLFFWGIRVQRILCWNVGPICQCSSLSPNYENTKHFPKPKCNESRCLYALVRYLRNHVSERERDKISHPSGTYPSEIGCICFIRTKQDITCFRHPRCNLKRVCPHLHSSFWFLETFPKGHWRVSPLLSVLENSARAQISKYQYYKEQLFDFEQIV